MSKETKRAAESQGSACSVSCSVCPPEGPLPARDCVWDISKGSRMQSLFSFRGKLFPVSSLPFLS